MRIASLAKIVVALILCFAANAGAIDLGKKLTGRLVGFPLNPPLDSAAGNVFKWPDSAAICVWAMGADTGATSSQTIYSARTTTVTAVGLAAIGIRADSNGTNTPYFVFADSGVILNGGSTARQVVGAVYLWRANCPFTTPFTADFYADTLKDEVKTVAGTSQTARDLGAQLDSATSKVGIGDGAIGAAEIATDAIGSSELATTAAAEIADASGDSVWSATVTPVASRTVTVTTNNDKTGYTSSLTAGQFTKVSDSVKGIMISDTTAKLQTASTGRVKVDTVYKSVFVGSQRDSVYQRQSQIILGDSTKRVFTGLFTDTSKRLDSVTVDVSNSNAAGGLIQTVTSKILNDTTKRVKFSNDSVVAIDPVRTVVLTTPAPTIKQIRDTIIKSTDTGRIRVDGQGYLFVGNVMLDTTNRVPLKGDAGTDSVRGASFSVSVDTASVARSVWDNDVVARANRTVDQVDTIVLACIDGDTVSSAGDFLKTALDYREAIKNIYGVATSNSTWMTDTVLNQLIRQAVVKVNPIMRGVKFKDTVITAWQQSDYNLDSMIGVISVSWQKEDTVRPITYAPLETWGGLQHQSTWGGDDPYLSRPSVYDVTDNQIMFFPPPTQTDTIEIVGFRKVYGIVTTSDFSAIPQAYRIPVLYYAAFLVAQSKQHPGTERMLNEYNKAVSDVLMALNRRVNAPTDSK